MTHFEYLAVMVSIILGLGIVRLLGSVDKVFSSSRYWPHAIWILNVFWIHVQNWWAFWEMRNIPFNIMHYSYWISYVSLMYLTTVALTNKTCEKTHWEEHYFERRRWFFGVMTATIVIAALMSRVFFDAPLLHPYRIVQVSLLIICIIGFASDRRHVHQVVAPLFFAVLTVGLAIYRFLPDLFGSAT